MGKRVKLSQLMDLTDATQKTRSLDSDKPASFQYFSSITLFPQDSQPLKFGEEK